ncbi:hypothetical protein ACFLS1_05420 [Verrucomicrobiota bacterium]
MLYPVHLKIVQKLRTFNHPPLNAIRRLSEFIIKNIAGISLIGCWSFSIIPASMRTSQTAEKCILVMGDEDGVLKGHESVLVQKGYSVFSASDFVQACGFLNKENISLFLYNMSDEYFRGLYVYKALRRKKKISSLFITAYPELFNMGVDLLRQTWITEFSEGRMDILYEPFDCSLLHEKVESLIGPAD